MWRFARDVNQEACDCPPALSIERISVSSSLLAGYDEPERLVCSILEICLTDADGRQPNGAQGSRSGLDILPQLGNPRHVTHLLHERCFAQVGFDIL